jgi:hypothetical protein
MIFPPRAKKLLLAAAIMGIGYSAGVSAQDTASAIRGRL